MSRPTANQRLFIAVYPPAEICRGMVTALGELEHLPAHCATPFEQIHLTLQFVGDVPEKDLDRVKESVERSTVGIGALQLRPLQLVTLPHGETARLVACETDAPGKLLDLHRRLAVRLVTRKNRADAVDGYRPHLVLGRFASPSRMQPLSHAVSLPPFCVEQIQLMRSVLEPGGARHRLVHQYRL